MNFQKVNNITGWIVGLVACAVYILTMEPTGSLWDCGEFVSSAYKLQIPHPPGAPLFILLGRLFSMFTPQDAAVGVNLLSALSSGFTIMFLFWTITHFGRRLFYKANDELTGPALFNVMAAGVIGALAYTFSDSFWFSAVEGEVYAMSSFFTALVFWMILKWDHEDEKAGDDDLKRTHAERWIVLIFFMMGLSIGVHLLNLLTIPAIVLVYYFRRYKPTWSGGTIAFLIGCAVTGIVQKAVIQWSIAGSSWFDRLFVNSFNLPIFSGFIFFFFLLAILIWLGLRWAHENHKRFLRLGLWSFAFMLIGYSTYMTTMIRSNADPAVDMNDVNNPIALESYLSREQYGDVPLLKGQIFTAEADYEETGDSYQRVGNKYEVVGKKRKAVYPASQTMVFPRVWDASNDQGHADYYGSFLDLDIIAPFTGQVVAASKNEELADADGQVIIQVQNGQKQSIDITKGSNVKVRPGQYVQAGQRIGYSAPNFRQNLEFFFKYQVNIMYWRYFMWNFAGKQNDVQGVGEKRNGNWISGIGPLDNFRLGNQKLMPDSLKKNQANNKLFLLPFILGLLGFAFQYYKNRKDWLVTLLLFFFTGMAIVLYLNQAGPQPRERDYAYVGSFYAFAIWIGLGYFQVKEWLDKLLKGSTSAYAAALLCFAAVPLLMAVQEWDDHDRSKKTLAPDLATDYLESCAPNAILFTVGDNDTYPLWYAQEVKGVRPDIRVVNTSLLGTDWYINQLRYAVNKSAPFDVLMTEDQIVGDKRNVVYHIPQSEADTAWVDLYKLLKDQVGSEDNAKKFHANNDEFLNYFNSNRVIVPVDKTVVLQNGTVSAKDSVVNEVRFEIAKSYLFKNDLAIMNIIAANKWKRPIYFTQPIGLGFDDYLRQDGLTYRFVPVANARGSVNVDWMYDNIMVKNKFKYGSADKKNVYYDEENRRHLVNIRNAHTMLAMNLIQLGRKEDAKKVLQKVDQMISEKNMPYGYASRYGNDHNEKSMYMGMTALQAGDLTLGKRILESVKKDCLQQVAYYESLSDDQMGPSQQYEYQKAKEYAESVDQIIKQFGGSSAPAKPSIEPGGPAIKNKPDSPKK
ncbi:MAG: DUF2723 domain-containing protein [Chitinophagaceae bacterium]|nr:DUF2723 domain-containing protein [Chitinophagaceae bacterium]